MMIKGKWKDVYLSLFTKVSVTIMICVPALAFIIRFIKEYDSFLGAHFALTMTLPTVWKSIAITLLLYIPFLIVFALLINSDIERRIDWHFNVKRKVVKEQHEIRSVPVVARFAGYKPTRPASSRESFSVNVQLDENVYYSFSGIEEYAMTKEGEMVEVEVKLYIDADGDVFYIEPLGIVKSNPETLTQTS